MKCDKNWEKRLKMKMMIVESWPMINKSEIIISRCRGTYFVSLALSLFGHDDIVIVVLNEYKKKRIDNHG